MVTPPYFYTQGICMEVMEIVCFGNTVCFLMHLDFTWSFLPVIDFPCWDTSSWSHAVIQGLIMPGHSQLLLIIWRKQACLNWNSIGLLTSPWFSYQFLFENTKSQIGDIEIWGQTFIWVSHHYCSSVAKYLSNVQGVLSAIFYPRWCENSFQGHISRHERWDLACWIHDYCSGQQLASHHANC